MKMSTNWLNDYVDVSKIPTKTLANKLIMTGTNIQNYVNETEKYRNIFIGKIVSIEKHSNADSLFVCQVDLKTRTVQIVTSATNIKIGALIPVCLDGAITANGIKIKKSKLRGVVSEGMMCSLAEVGLSKTNFPYADENGIFLIQEPCEAGQTFSEAFHLNDTIFDFEITSNRPDCLSAVGLALEISAAFNLPLKFKQPKNYCENKNGDRSFNVEIQSKNCLRYMAKVVDNVKIKPSPSWLTSKLKNAGVQPINNIVDLTNFVMLELGIPMHAYDFDEIEGQKIVVRQAKAGETLETLMNSTAELSETDLVICDTKKPLCVAGIIGGKPSAIKPSTKKIVLEVGCFEKTGVRKTAQKFLAKTESAIRFEKGLNPVCCQQSLNRACELIEKLNIGNVLEETTDIQNFTNDRPSIKLEPEKINKLIGFNLNKTDMVNILNSLQFTVTNNDEIFAPPHRIDIENSADIAEEIARIYGYNKIESVPQTSVSDNCENEFWQLEQQIKEYLIGLGCDETYSYSFSNLKEMDKIGLDTQKLLDSLVEIKNPFGEETRFLKISTIPAMLNNLALNFNNKQKSAFLFELGKTYEMCSNDTPKEQKKITIGIYDKNCDFFTIKGIVQALLSKLKLNGCEFNPISKMPFHDYIGCKISLKDIEIGQLGEIHPQVCENFNLKTKVFVAVLDLETIFKNRNKKLVFKPISKFPESSFDLTLICDEGVLCGQLESVIKKTAADLFKSCTMFSVYYDKNIGDNKKSISFNIVLQSQDHTLSKEEITTTMEKMLDNLKKLGATLKV